MATTTTYATLKEFARDANFDGLKSRDDRTIARAIAAALERLTNDCRWSFLREVYRLVTTASHSGTATVSVSGTTVTVGTMVFSSADVARFIEFNGEAIWYEILTYSAPNVAIKNAYQGSANLTLADSIVVQPYVTLPANFDELIGIVPLGSAPELAWVEPLQMQLMQNDMAGASTPTAYSIYAKRNNTGKQFWLYPPPSTTVYQYEMLYHKRAGYLMDGANETWLATPTSDNDIVTWPNEKLSLLRRAIHMCLAEDVGSDAFIKLQAMYQRALIPAMKADNDHGQTILLGRSAPSGWGVVGSQVNF